MLRCEVCGRVYPIVDGIPRMLPDSAGEFAEMMEGFGIPRNTCRENERRVRQFREMHGATREAFTFHSLHYSVPGLEENRSFFENATGYGARQLSGRMVLDAGCGTGRFMEAAAGMGAHVVGIDISRSVDRAYRETRFKSQIDLIQGDLMNPPFRSECFDALYSIGALNRTPNSMQSFQSICGLLRPGGRAAIWMDHSTRLSEWLSDGMRYFTTRIPHRLLHYVCIALAPFGELKRFADTNKMLSVLFAPILLLPVSNHRDWKVRIGNTFAWLAPPNLWKHTTREVLAWFEAEGFEAIHPLNGLNGVTGDRHAATQSTSPDLENTRTQHAYAGR